MPRQHGKRDILYDGSPALKELTENYATMDVKAFCAKWGLSIATVRSTASRRGLHRLRGKEAKIGTANTNKDIQRPVLPKPEPETPPVPAYEPPKDMIPPSLLKQVRGRRLRAWKKSLVACRTQHDACTVSVQRNRRRTLQPRVG